MADVAGRFAASDVRASEEFQLTVEEVLGRYKLTVDNAGFRTSAVL